MNNEEQFVMATLIEVNRARARMGWATLDELPCGLRNDKMHCPLAEALDAEISPKSAYFDNDGVADKAATAWGTTKLAPREVVLPYYLQKFVRCVDQGELSQYILNASGELREAA